MGSIYVAVHSGVHCQGTLFALLSSTVCSEWSLTDIVGEKDDKERSDEVIDSLDVAAGGVTHRPDEQYPLETLLHDLLLEEGDVGIHTGNIDGDLGMGWG